MTPGPLWLPDGREAELSPLAAGYLLRVRTVASPHRARLRLSFLGRDQPVATLDGRDLVLGMRHAEILAVLALHEHGVSAERLASALYGESGNPVTAPRSTASAPNSASRWYAPARTACPRTSTPTSYA